MHLMEMSHWLWTWEAWGKVKYGSMVRVLEDIGQRMLLEIVAIVVILGRFDLQNANSVVANQLNDGKPLTRIL